MALVAPFSVSDLGITLGCVYPLEQDVANGVSLLVVTLPMPDSVILLGLCRATQQIVPGLY